MNQPLVWSDIIQVYLATGVLVIVVTAVIYLLIGWPEDRNFIEAYLIGLAIVIALTPVVYGLMWWAGKRKQNNRHKP